MQRLIAIETSSDTCSVAAFSGPDFIQEIHRDEPRSHAAHLAPMIQQILNESLSGTVDVIAVSSGPGSFTGLRIGVSTAKGLAFARDAKIVSVPTLESIARGMARRLIPRSRPDHSGNIVQSLPLDCELNREKANQHIIVATPSRRGEIYLAAYQCEKDTIPRNVMKECAVPISSFNDRLEQEGIASGIITLTAAIPELKEVVQNNRRYLFEFSKPSALDVGYCALSRAARHEFEDISVFEPYYLKAFHAKKPHLSALDRLSF